MLAKKNDGGPAVLRFKARLRQDRGRKAPSIVLDFPVAVGKQVAGMVRIEGTINGHPFRAPLDSNDSGQPSLRVNHAMLSGAKAKLGDAVSLAILGPEPKRTPPPDLRKAFKEFPEAKAFWAELTEEIHRDWIRWIESAKTDETRTRRVTRTVEQLMERKRRPCCVNFYEYMLNRIESD